MCAILSLGNCLVLFKYVSVYVCSLFFLINQEIIMLILQGFQKFSQMIQCGTSFLLAITGTPIVSRLKGLLRQDTGNSLVMIA